MNKTVIRELILFVSMALAGIVLVPLAVFFVGELVFGEYGGDSFGQFFESLLGKLASADRFAWLLVVAPYLVLQLLRGMRIAWRRAGTASS